MYRSSRVRHYLIRADFEDVEEDSTLDKSTSQPAPSPDYPFYGRNVEIWSTVRRQADDLKTRGSLQLRRMQRYEWYDCVSRV